MASLNRLIRGPLRRAKIALERPVSTEMHRQFSSPAAASHRMADGALSSTSGQEETSKCPRAATSPEGASEEAAKARARAHRELAAEAPYYFPHLPHLHGELRRRAGTLPKRKSYFLRY